MKAQKVRIQFTLAAIASLFVILPADLSAQCQYTACQSEGAVSLPSGWDISLPFENGERVRVDAAYGPLAGSRLHCRASDAYCANDWYALDLVLPDHSNSGKGQPVVAIADGTVIDEGWASGNWENYGRRVYLRHTVNGTEYTSMYAHLDSINVSDGQSVSKGDQLGTLGQSCKGADSCGSFSIPHLHFSIHHEATFGGSGSGGSHGGHAVIPEPIDGYTGLSQGMDMTSENGEDPPDPPTDCGVIGMEVTLIQEDGPCGDAFGALTDVTSGSGGHSFTAELSTPSPEFATGVIWEFAFQQAGRYHVSVYVPDGVNTQRADYKIQYADAANEHIYIDQSAVAGTLLPLGTYDFDTVTDQWLRLGDNYGDGQYAGQTFGMDAVRLVPESMCVCSEQGVDVVVQTCPDGEEIVAPCDGCLAPTLQTCLDAGTPDMGASNNATPANNDSDGTPDAGTGGNGGDDGGQLDVQAKGGCGCSAAPSSISGAALLLILIALAIGRRY